MPAAYLRHPTLHAMPEFCNEEFRVERFREPRGTEKYGGLVVLRVGGQRDKRCADFFEHTGHGFRGRILSLSAGTVPPSKRGTLKGVSRGFARSAVARRRFPLLL